jgi:hypothetical protein
LGRFSEAMMAALVPRLEVVVFLRDSASAQKSSVDVVVGRHSGTLAPAGVLSPTAEPTPTEAHRRYWLERFTLDEIREMAFAFWPENGDREADRDAEDGRSTSSP